MRASPPARQGSTATEPALALVLDALAAAAAAVRDHGAPHAELLDAALALEREEAAVGRGEVRRLAEDGDVALD